MKQEMIDFFKETVISVSKLSKCVSHKVGSIIVKDERIISMGYNGTPTGFKNCCDTFDKDNFDREEHHKWSLIHEIHSEVNSITFAAKNNISTENAIMFCTLQPCNDCMKMILQAGIKELYYINEYDKTLQSNDFNKYLKSKILIKKI